MKTQSSLLLLLLGIGLISSTNAEIPKDFMLGGLPKTNGLVKHLDITVITNVAYVVGYDETRKDPIWVAYKLVKHDPPFKLPRPASTYFMDPHTKSKVPQNGYSHDPKSQLIGNKKWAHGHMAANDAIAKAFGEDAQLATFKMSNMCPQAPRLNGGKWKVLEGKEHKYAQKFGEVWTVCGPIFSTHLATLSEGVEVPSAYYKILIRKDGAKLTAMAVQFEFFPKLGENSILYLKNHLVSIDDLEKLTGLDFFSALPATVENDLEAAKATTIW